MKAIKKPKKMFLGVDQYGHCYPFLIHPRKELIEKIGVSHVSKMYVDKKSGEIAHVGYVIGGLWVELFEMNRFSGVVS